MTAQLVCSDLAGGRGSTTVFRDVDLQVAKGEVMAVLGPNGAGKSTLLMTIAGLLPPHGGSVEVAGSAIRGGRAAAANRAGVVLVPDDRCLFPSLSTKDHLAAAGGRRSDPRSLLDLFPALERRWDVAAGALSGGEQQMLAMARALIQQPKVLLVDEMSMGLAPLLTEALFATIRRVAVEHGCAIVLVEQHVNLALEVADVATVLNRGRVVLAGPANEVGSQADLLADAYLGSFSEAPTSGESSAQDGHVPSD